MTVRDQMDAGDVKLEHTGPRAGDRLRAARMDMGMSEADVAAALHLDVRTVEALEAEDVSSLPPPTFTRGYFKSYARLLGVDENAVLRSYARDHGADQPAPTLTVPPPVETSPQLSRSLFSGLIAIVLLGGAGAAGYWYYTNHGLPGVGPTATEPDQQQSDERAPEVGSSTTPEDAWQAAEEEDLSRGTELDEGRSDGPVDSADVTDEPAEPVPGDPGIADVPAPNPEDAFTAELAGPEVDQADDGAEEDASPPAAAASTEPESPSPVDDEAGAEEPAAAVDESESSGDATDVASDAVTDEPEPSPDFSSEALVESVDDALAANAGLESQPLVLTFSGSSWIEVYDDDGERLLYGLIRDEGTQSVEGRPPYTVVVGDADNVDLEYGGDPVDLGQRRPGRVARIQVPR